jgi:hypothetical protein
VRENTGAARGERNRTRIGRKPVLSQFNLAEMSSEGKQSFGFQAQHLSMLG